MHHHSLMTLGNQDNEKMLKTTKISQKLAKNIPQSHILNLRFIKYS